VIDEIGRELEAAAARTIAERGVQLIGTAHGQTIDNLLLNPTLSDLMAVSKPSRSQTKRRAGAAPRKRCSNAAPRPPSTCWSKSSSATASPSTWTSPPRLTRCYAVTRSAEIRSRDAGGKIQIEKAKLNPKSRPDSEFRIENGNTTGPRHPSGNPLHPRPRPCHCADMGAECCTRAS